MTHPRSTPPPPEPLNFDIAKRLLQSPDPKERLKVAAHAGARPELLYYLASDATGDVRRAIAVNPSTPRQADALLSRDSDAGVRGGLARKLAQLLPSLPPERLGQLEKLTLEILETLARDQAAEVRTILAEELKNYADAPHSVISTLARDIELNVSGPVLRHSPILTDEDLLEIIIGGPPDGALSAIAKRAGVSPIIAEAIATSDDTAAVTVLLANASAQIREETLDRIIERAPQHEPWHAPLVRRPRLPARAAARLASFVADSLLRELQARTDLGPAVALEVANAVRQRIDRNSATAGQAGGSPPSGSAPGSPAPGSIEAAAAAAGSIEAAAAAAGPDKGKEKGKEKEKVGESPIERVRRLAKEGKLDEATIAAALTGGERPFVLAALAERAGAPQDTVERILGTHTPRPVVSLVWKAGLSMRFAREIQVRLAQIPPQKALNPRGGSDYPMNEAEMRWQLDFFGLGGGDTEGESGGA
ncbi:DUF2336 domain-containing protein [uncultured Gammaproteobacteria bacterium]